MTGAPMRVAIVAAGPGIVGGQGNQAMQQADALRAEGIGVDFIAVNPPFPPCLRWLRRLRGARTLLNQGLYLKSLRALREADVVHVFSASYWSFLLGPAPAMSLARRFKRRVVLNYHSGEAESHLARWGALVHPWLRQAQEIVVPSDFLRRIFERHGYRARVIRNVVDTRRFRYRDRVPLRPRLLSTRNLEPYYRVDDTLRAFALIKRSHPDATLTIAGYGSEEARLRRLAADLGAGGIRFVGRVEPDDMPALCDEADIFVNASVVDNQPVSILEAFASGLPVVTTPTGDIPAMVQHGLTGFLVPPHSPEAMARSIRDLVDQPDWAVRMAHAASRSARQYSWPCVRDAWAAVYAGGTS